MAETLGEAKSIIWYIVKKTECTDQLSNTKISEREQKITKVDDHRIISLVQEINFTASKQVEKLSRLRQFAKF